jgi:hypothetical protein
MAVADGTPLSDLDTIDPDTTVLAENALAALQEQRDGRTGTPPSDEALSPETVRILWDEFKLVQDKLDRIGDFHFRVRTWAITLVSAVAVTGAANKLVWYVYPFFCLPVVSFHLIDRAQTGWQSALVGRAVAIEALLQQATQDKAPFIVKSIRRKEKELRQPLLGYWIIKNGRVFYIVMYFILLAAACNALLGAVGVTTPGPIETKQ